MIGRFLILIKINSTIISLEKILRDLSPSSNYYFEKAFSDNFGIMIRFAMYRYEVLVYRRSLHKHMHAPYDLN